MQVRAATRTNGNTLGNHDLVGKLRVQVDRRQKAVLTRMRMYPAERDKVVSADRDQGM